MSAKASCVAFRRAPEGARVVAFEDSIGRPPWEVEQLRRQAPLTKSPGWWIGRLIEARESERMRTQNAVGKPAPVVDQHGTPSERLLLAWAPVDQEIRGAVDELTWRLWLADVHPHALVSGAWRLACDPRRVGWVRERYGRLIADCAGRPVEFVACGAAS